MWENYFFNISFYFNSLSYTYIFYDNFLHLFLPLYNCESILPVAPALSGIRDVTKVGSRCQLSLGLYLGANAAPLLSVNTCVTFLSTLTRRGTSESTSKLFLNYHRSHADDKNR